MKHSLDPKAPDIGIWRYGIISSLLHQHPDDGPMYLQLESLSQRPYYHPDGRQLQYSPETLRKWLYRFRQGGLPIYLLEKFGITAAKNRLRQYLHELSGGLRQRVMIAMMLMCEPKLIIADEPTTALDVTIQAQILHLLSDLQRELNMAMIIITHDLGIVARVSDRVTVMYAGQIVETGDAAEVFHNPIHPYTQGLLESIPVSGKVKPGCELGSIPGIVPSLKQKIQGCRFADRCHRVTDKCRQNEVPLTDSGKNRAS